MLFLYNADVNVRDSYGFTALMRAVSEKNLDIVKILLEAGADVNAKNSNGSTALIGARSDNIVKLLIEAGAEIDAQDSEGKTALMRVSNEIPIDPMNKTKVLLEAGADVDIEDNKGKTALDHAADKKCFELVKLLMRFGDQPFEPKRMKRILVNCEEEARERKRQRLEDSDDD